MTSLLTADRPAEPGFCLKLVHYEGMPSLRAARWPRRSPALRASRHGLTPEFSGALFGAASFLTGRPTRCGKRSGLDPVNTVAVPEEGPHREPHLAQVAIQGIRPNDLGVPSLHVYVSAALYDVKIVTKAAPSSIKNPEPRLTVLLPSERMSASAALFSCRISAGVLTFPGW